MSYSRRLVVATVALLTTLSIGALAKSPQAKEASAAEQAVLKAEHQPLPALPKADTPALEKLLADELSYTHSNAQVQDKAAFISDIKTGKIKYLTIEATD